MPSPAILRKQRLRMTKAQLIDQIDTLEQRVAAIEAANRNTLMRAKATDRYLANQELADLARFPSENPNPVLRVMPNGKVLYANDTARAVDGLIVGGKRSMLTRKLAKVLDVAQHGGKGREQEFTSDDRVFAFVLTPVPDESYINVYGRDVTEEHRAKQELVTAQEASAAAEALLRDAIDNISEGFVVYDSDERLVTCNQKWKEIYGYSEEDATPGVKYEDLVRLDLAKGVIADQHSQVESYYKQRFAYRKEDEGEFEVELADGRWILIRERLTSSGGRVGIQADITERKRTEKALQDSREQLTAVIDAVPAMINAKDTDSRYLFVNRYQAELYGVSKDEAIGKTSGQLLDRKYGAYTRKLDRKVIESGEALPYFEEEHVDAFGMRRALLATKVPLKDEQGRVHGVVTVALDITDRKRIEKALAEKEAQLRLALDNMPGGITVGDRNWNFVFFNAQYSELHDYPKGLLKVGGSVLDETRFQIERGDYGSGDPDKLSEESYVPYRSGKPESYERTLPNGRTLHFNVAPTPEGGYITIATDITERKRAEDELRKSREQLQALADNLPEFISMKDSDERFVFVNKRFEEWICQSREDVVGKTVFDIYNDDQAKEFHALDQQVIDGREVLSEEADLTYPDGKARAIIRTRFPVISSKGEMLGLGTVNHDITELKCREKELAEKEAQLRVALDNMAGGMKLVDRDLNYVIFNAQYSELCELPDGLIEVGGSTVDELRYQAERGDFGPGNKDDLIEKVLAMYRQGDPGRWERTIASSGRTLDIYVAPTPEGGYVSILNDITERKRAEEALREAKRLAEEASKLVTEKNQMLESLSNQLSKYLPPQVYASIFSGEQTVEIASKRKKLTVFFSDIADFTETTDRLEPEELTNLLNHYLTEMSRIALEYGATIDKYVGDGITAFFGDPESRGVKEDATAAVNMAIAMQKRMRELQSEWLDRGLEEPFQIRVGINTGFCTVGNFGSEDRMDYTINGSEVNLAARLESHAEVGGILLAHETYSLVKDTVLAEERDALTVKGFAKPVRSYAVVGVYDDLANQGRIIRRGQEGLALVIDRNKLTKKGKAEVIKTLEDVLSQIKE